MLALEEHDHLAGRLAANVHMERGDELVIVTDPTRKIAKLDHVDRRLAYLDRRIEQLRERRGGMARADVADLF